LPLANPTSPHRTLTSANAVKVTKLDLSQQQQQHHWHHITVIKSFVWLAASKVKRLAKLAATAPIANFAK
jgi:hypothetical protein